MRSILTTDGYKVLIDDEDYELVSQYRWVTFVPNGNQRYARSYYSEMGRQVSLHRFLLNPEKGKVVDHINGNGLDCRRVNMRVCAQSQNCVNRKSGRVRNAVYSKFNGKWDAKVTVNRKTLHLGYYDTAEEASDVAREYMEKVHGEFYQTR